MTKPLEDKDGLLDKPQWGPMPEQRFRGLRGALKVFEFEELLEAVRERPGEAAAIAMFVHGGKERTLHDLNRQKARVKRWLEKYRPNEFWEIQMHSVPDTWCQRELWVCFLGTLNAEELLQLKELRKEAFSFKRARAGDPDHSEKRVRAQRILKDWGNTRRKALLG